MLHARRITALAAVSGLSVVAHEAVLVNGVRQSR
jgi:hypothetical protein